MEPNSRLPTKREKLLFHAGVVFAGLDFFIGVLFGFKYFGLIIANVIFAFLIFIAIVSKRKFQLSKLAFRIYFSYIIPFAILTIGFAKVYDTPFYLNFLTLIVVPILFSIVCGLIAFKIEDLVAPFKLLVGFGLIGCLLQLFGIYNEFLIHDASRINETFVNRFTSFYGGTLAFGFVAAMGLIFFLNHTSKARINKHVWILMSFVELVLSQSRRALFIAIIVTKIRTKTIKKYFYVILLLPLAIYGLISLNIPAINRIMVDTFDFSANNSSNFGRLTKWTFGFNKWLEKPIYGHGLGQFSVAGKEIDPNVSASELEITESFFLKLLSETGLLGLLFFLSPIILSLLAKVDTGLAKMIIVFFVMDAVIGGYFEGYFQSMVFWIAIFGMANYKSNNQFL